MILNPDNELDKKLAEIYSEEALNNMTIEDDIQHLAMKIKLEPNSDIDFKIYNTNKHSKNESEKYKDEPIINFLNERNMIEYWEQVVNNSDNADLVRYNFLLNNNTDENVLALFDFFRNNTTFFSKYEDEIIEMSKMKLSDTEDSSYPALFFIGIINKLKETKILKVYWLNPNDVENEYYLNYIENSNIEKLKDLIPTTRKLLENCEAKMWGEGIDYSDEYSTKHKIYLRKPKNLFEGLVKTFPDDKEFAHKIDLIKEWQDEHPEFNVLGFYVGKNSAGNMLLTIYFKYLDVFIR